MKNPLKSKGSVLVFSLIVLSIVLSAALSVAVVNVSNRKSAGSTGQSVQSFQVADSGVEKALKEIYKGSYTDLSTMRASITGSTVCSNGSFSFPVSGGTSTVTFFDTDNVVIGCTESDWRNLVAKIKVEGTSAGTTRVIETAVAAPVSPPYGCYTFTVGGSSGRGIGVVESGKFTGIIRRSGASDSSPYLTYCGSNASCVSGALGQSYWAYGYGPGIAFSSSGLNVLVEKVTISGEAVCP
jgi:Tfp pilus assembly protein PilX